MSDITLEKVRGLLWACKEARTRSNEMPMFFNAIARIFYPVRQDGSDVSIADSKVNQVSALMLAGLARYQKLFDSTSYSTIEFFQNFNNHSLIRFVNIMSLENSGGQGLKPSFSVEEYLPRLLAFIVVDASRRGFDLRCATRAKFAENNNSVDASLSVCLLNMGLGGASKMVTSYFGDPKLSYCYYTCQPQDVTQAPQGDYGEEGVLHAITRLIVQVGEFTWPRVGYFHVQDGPQRVENAVFAKILGEVRRIYNECDTDRDVSDEGSRVAADLQNIITNLAGLKDVVNPAARERDAGGQAGSSCDIEGVLRGITVWRWPVRAAREELGAG